MKNKKTKLVISIVLVIACVIVISIFSSQSIKDSLNTSDVFLKTFFSMFGIENTTQNVDTWSYIIRKCAHITEYFILGILIMNVLFKFEIELKQKILISILLCAGLAGLDEFHQFFSSGRSAQVMDVFIDSFGAILGILTYSYFCKKKNLE